MPREKGRKIRDGRNRREACTAKSAQYAEVGKVKVREDPGNDLEGERALGMNPDGVRRPCEAARVPSGGRKVETIRT